MFVNFHSAEIYGIEGRVLDVEVDVHPRLSSFVISGLPGKGVRDSRERIRAAVVNSGFEFPSGQRIVVNLAPAAWEKSGAVLDLPIALGILTASGQLRLAPGAPWGVLGELSLDGEVRPVPGTLALVSALQARGVARALVPARSMA